MYGRLLQSSVEKMIDSAQTKAMSYCNECFIMHKLYKPFTKKIKLKEFV